MDYSQKFREAEEALGQNRVEETIEIYKEIMAETEGTDTYYWALKRLADVVGYVSIKDYFQSIDMYQKIITEYEGEDNNLYELTQLDVARAYLELGLEMIGNFDSTISIFEPQNETAVEYMDSLIERRNHFVETEANKVFHGRM